jgi:hypothetical protein
MSFLDREIKGKEYKQLERQGILPLIFGDEHSFSIAKSKGVGEDTIKNFLGPNWSLWKIRQALATLHTDTSKFDRKASEKMKTVEAASTFRKAVIN